MNCNDCKYFIIDDKYCVGTDWHGEVLANNGRVGKCNKVNYISQFSRIGDIKEYNIMHSVSEWGDGTEIIVGEMFGCIHFEKKNK